MKHISIDNKIKLNVSNLCSHKDLVSLKFLYCDSFPDLTPLRDLEMLMEISISSSNNIEDLSFLSALTGLEKLSISGCGSLVDVSAIQNFKKLTSLQLTNLSALTDISPLNKLTNLRSLSLIGCQSITDLTPLATLEHIEQFSVDDSKSLSGSTNSTQLDSITDLTINYISDSADLQNLRKYKQVQKLTLHNCNRLSDLSAIPELDNLIELSMSACNNLNSLAPLGKFKKLDSLTIKEGENVKSLVFIGELSMLTVLQLTGFRLVDDITPLGKLTKLIRLTFSRGLRLRNINALSKLGKLENLNLTQCINITDLGPLSELKQLKTLDLTSCYSIIDLKPLEKLFNLDTLSIKSCYLDKDIYPLRERLSLSKIDTDNGTYSRKRNSSINLKPDGGFQVNRDLEKYNYEDLLENVYYGDSIKRFRFVQFKASWKRFQLDEFEKYVECEFDKYKLYPFTRLTSTSEFCTRTDHRPEYPLNTYIVFDCVYNRGVLEGYPSQAWLAVGPWRITNQAKYRYFEVFELSSKEQLKTLIVDGFMESLEERYFWCAKLIAWIEDNCRSYETDIENTLAELMEFYMIDGIYNDGYDDTDFSLLFINVISMLAEAADKDLSVETISVMQAHSSMYFSSYVKPSRNDLELFAEKFKWEIVKNQLNDVYGDNSDQVVDSEYSNNTGIDNKQSIVYSERFHQLADNQATRVSDRAFRAIDIFIDIAGQVLEKTTYSSLNEAIKDIHNAISNMSAANSQVYTEKLFALKNIDHPHCSNKISEIFKELNIQ